jgi:hypothetical protein
VRVLTAVVLPVPPFWDRTAIVADMRAADYRPAKGTRKVSERGL